MYNQKKYPFQEGHSVSSPVQSTCLQLWLETLVIGVMEGSVSAAAAGRYGTQQQLWWGSLGEWKSMLPSPCI